MSICTYIVIIFTGHKDVAFREFEDVKVNLKRIQGQDPRTSVFARLCNVFSPLPREMSQVVVVDEWMDGGWENDR
jgi:hypothetical protein